MSAPTMQPGNAHGAPREVTVAIVGAGPAGLYTADLLLKQSKQAEVCHRIDIFERLVAPFGLVRSGVAPDHQGIKKVTKAFERTLENERVRYFGNVAVGRDITHAELCHNYDQVVYSFGAARDRRLGISGEALPGSHAATEFVGWYNGHPDFVDLSFDLNTECAVVVGLGNVAMDVARILARDPEELATTDISGAALDALRQSRVREVILLGRRGPAEAAFSPREIRDIDELAGVTLRLDPSALEGINTESLSGDSKKNVEFLREVAARPTPAVTGRLVTLAFLRSPVEILGQDRVSQVRVEKNQLSMEGGRQRARGSGQFEQLSAGLILRSIGYRGSPLPGLPFDEQSGTIPNDHGRVLTPGGGVLPGVYTAGWVKRGPTGLIGTNKSDAKDTVDQMLADCSALPARVDSRTGHPISDLLKERNVRSISLAEWKALDRYEVSTGEQYGKVREKLLSQATALSVLGDLSR